MEKVIEYIYNLNKNQSKLEERYNFIINYNPIGFIPAVRYEVALLLNIIASIKRPKDVLDIGFGSGASSIFIKDGCNDNSNIISLERDKNRFLRGEKLLEHLNISMLNIINDTALAFFENNKIKFDFVFLDSAKNEYVNLLPIIKNNLSKEGLLIVDNTLFNNKVVEDIEKIEKRHKNIVSTLKEFNHILSNDNDFKTIFLSIGDGVSISILMVTNQL